MTGTPLATWIRTEGIGELTLSAFVDGDCMKPVLRDGSRIAIRLVSRYRAGDIVATLGHDDRIYAHRLLGSYRWRGRKLYLTQADNGSRADAATPHVLGRIDSTPPPTVRVRWRSRMRFARALLRRSVAKFPVALLSIRRRG